MVNYQEEGVELTTTQLINYLKTPILRGSAQPAFTCSNSIELTSIMYKVNNKDT